MCVVRVKMKAFSLHFRLDNSHQLPVVAEVGILHTLHIHINELAGHIDTLTKLQAALDTVREVEIARHQAHELCPRIVELLPELGILGSQLLVFRLLVPRPRIELGTKS